ncbi:hypothetical protein NADFUDRAFT_43872 [Nadsonia fulvescens var. elongata DSM 6958]|uniref:Uncharacterized protein n=1 Tax=Nadsonia fulvescens var. elongata DSM 6958 TaxID=857566 RepID=A0A1E3PF91_9ASCO|nr:hypothetical protein NADFUDRAFT_43872 [Nadsonia fulvescens var. elongata DSM 6958]
MNSSTLIPLPPVPRLPHHLLSPIVSSYMYTDSPVLADTDPRHSRPSGVDCYSSYGTAHDTDKTDYSNNVPCPVKLQIGNLIDMKIQEIILKHPIIRSILVPDCDLNARSECVKLLGRIVAAAGMAYQFELTQKEKPQNGHFNSNSPLHNIHSQYTNSAGADNNHSVISGGGLNGVNFNHPRQPNSAYDPDGPTFSQAAITYTNLYYTLHILSAMNQRRSTVSWVFWEFWDSIFLLLSSVVGEEAVAQISAGRLFKETGQADTYKLNKKQKSKPRSPVSVCSDSGDKQNDDLVDESVDDGLSKLETISSVKRYGLSWDNGTMFNIDDTVSSEKPQSNDINVISTVSNLKTPPYNNQFEDTFKSATVQPPKAVSPNDLLMKHDPLISEHVTKIAISHTNNDGQYEMNHKCLKPSQNNQGTVKENISTAMTFPLLHQDDTDELMMDILSESFSPSMDIMGADGNDSTPQTYPLSNQKSLHYTGSEINQSGNFQSHCDSGSLSPTNGNEVSTPVVGSTKLGDNSFSDPLDQPTDQEDTLNSILDLRRKILMLEQENVSLGDSNSLVSDNSLNQRLDSISPTPVRLQQQSKACLKRPVQDPPVINMANADKKLKMEALPKIKYKQKFPVKNKNSPQTKANQYSFTNSLVVDTGGDDDNNSDVESNEVNDESLLITTAKPAFAPKVQRV